MSELAALRAICARECAIHMARKSEWLSVLLIYVMITSLFPVAIGNWQTTNAWLAPIIIWIAALVAISLAQDTLLRADYNAGVFEVMLLSKHALTVLLLGKMLVHWFIYCLPIVLITPFVAASLAMPMIGIVTVTLSLLFGSIFLSLMAAVGAALTVALARGGVFLTMLMLPLYIPMLCLGCDLGILSVEGVISTGHMALLLALVIVALCSAPLAVATAIKVNIE